MIETLIGVGVGVAATVVGLMTARLTRRPASDTAAPTVAALCGCGHDYAVHDTTDRTCHGQNRREHYTESGARNGYEWAPCPCRGFTGTPPVDVLGWSLPPGLSKGEN